MTFERGMIPLARMLRAGNYLHMANSEVATMLVGMRLARQFPEVAEDALIASAVSPFMEADHMDLLNQLASYIATGTTGDAALDFTIEHSERTEAE